MESISKEALQICHGVELVVKKQSTSYMAESIGDGIQRIPMYAWRN